MNPGEQVEKEEMLERLSQALAQLQGRCRELFRLKLQGRSFPEIQEVLGARSINTIYTWDFRCRKQLLEKLGGSWERKP
jgi:RNA polymerase sigma-70 factor (ECF subfamily)